MTTATATHHGEEMEVTFRARIERNDYGVRGSSFYETRDIEIDEVVILGCAVDHKGWPKDVTSKILALADDLDFE